MRILHATIFGGALAAWSCGGGDGPPATPEISAERLREHVRALSSDEMLGRAPGTPGEEAAVGYIARAFEAAGALPAGDSGGYFQRVPLVGVRPLPTTRIAWSSNGSRNELKWLEETVVVGHRQRAEDSLEAEVVYVGHGITAPEFGWDDYKGVDVAGKIVLLFTNEPPSDDAAFFGGKALTYYGRWTFKYEEALRRGAAGALIVHTDETAGYPWSVVRNSWSGVNPYVELKPDEEALTLAGWIVGAVGERLLRLSPETAGKTLEQLLELAHDENFRPIPLNLKIQADLKSEVSPLVTRNVVARVEGADPERKDEAIVYTAHWDHLGVDEAAESDGIYNGAVDNATGCAVLLELARAYGALDGKPARSIIFAAVGAEEGGLRGSQYYAENPVVPAGSTALNLNFDGIAPLPETRDITASGYERTTVKPTVEAIAGEFGYEILPEAHPEQGYYYRSDHFSLAKAGVPAFSLNLGADVVGKPAGWAEALKADYRAERYHRPGDEFDESWDFSGVAKLARFGFELGRRVAEQAELPSWREGDEFLPARLRSQGR